MHGQTTRRILRRTAIAVAASLVAAVVVTAAGSTPAQADGQATVAVSCDRPNSGISAGLFVNLNNEIPDPLSSSSLMQVVDTDPAIPGQASPVTLKLPFPDLAGGFPPNDFGVTYGTFYIKSVEITLPIPAGFDVTTVNPVESPATEYVTVTRVGGNLKVTVKSQRTDAHPNSYIRIDTEVASPVAEVRLLNGSWVPVVMPSIVVTPTVTAAPGSTITWRPPSLTNLVVKWNRNFGFLIGSIDWNDLAMPCVAANPNQAVATTTVASPGLSVTASADETDVVAGEDVHLHVTVANTGNVALTGVTVGGPAPAGCAGTVGTLGVGAQTTRDCTVTTSAGDIPSLSHSATADSDQTPVATSNTVQVAVAPAGPSSVAGRVVDAVSQDGIGGAWVALLRTSDFAIAASAVADGAGDFTTEVAAGTYFAYAIDPTGRHAAGFAGAPTPVTVPPGALAPVDPSLAPTRGAIAGTVTEDGSGAPVPGAWALVSRGADFAPEALAVADGSGAFSVDDVPAGNHFVAYVDPTGAHAPEYLGDAPGPAGAVPAVVTGGATTTADGTPPAQPPAPGGSTLSGVVTETGTDAPLEGVAVAAIRASDFGFVRGTTTDASGAYSLSVPEGSYRISFIDGSGSHHTEWHDNQPYTGLATSDPVAVPAVVDAGLDPSAGTVAGTVTDDPSGVPLAGVWALAIGPSGIAGGAVTGPGGGYTIAGLSAGTYRVTFADPAGGRVQEYWNDVTDFAAATPVVVAGGATTTIDGDLALP
ncbi:MAG: carboxypeptidase regulatory-like domain-containing protein [Microthrixaceae bacterium]|nr:carboxypeptidase regulatory-like domain-containing protein [Microthrixaceae bacterium]